MNNPIFAEYYPHEKCDCYKIKLPWPDYAEDKMVLCKVSEGYELAKTIALGVLTKHTVKVLNRPKQ
jgi:hypothetical protein